MTTSGRRALAIVQPYLPLYRVPLFEKVAFLLAEHGVDMQVLTGQPTGAQLARGDASHGNPWQVELRTREVWFRGRVLRFYNSIGSTRRAHAVICELSGGCLDSYLHILQRRKPVGVWGHVGRPTHGPTSFDPSLRLLARRASAVMTYSESGLQRVKAYGVNLANVHVIGNSFDTSAFEDALNTPSSPLTEVPRDTRVACFIGGLDESKGVPLLVDILEQLWVRKIPLHVIVCGEGELKPMLYAAAERGQVTLAGYVGPMAKAKALKQAEVIICPGRVGLVAVDSVVSGTPIVTISNGEHAPEWEYLKAGVSAMELPSNAIRFVDEFSELLSSPAALRQLSKSCKAIQLPSLDSMATNFASAALALLAKPNI